MQQALAMLNYQSQHGRLPPAVVYGEYGQPLLSWRVLILPYIEQDALFKQFRLDEPWDSPHNVQLLPKMPLIYAPPGRKAKLIPANHTICHVFVGKGTAFEEGLSLRSREDFTDGSSNTILLVEAGKPVPWTKPEELAYDPERPLPDLSGIFNDGFRVAYADGHRGWVSRRCSEANLPAAITRNGGKLFNPELLYK